MKLIKAIIPVIILALGIGVGAWYFANPEEAQKRSRPESRALLVETGHAQSGNFTASVEVMGQIIPASAAILKPQVSGEITEVAPEFVPGGTFKKGDTILKIDPADYQLAVQKQEAVLRQAQASYELEMGRQSVARQEMQILERTTGNAPENSELALRAPQLAQAEAELEKAKAELETARLSLERTTITAPFDALVTMREASLGDRVSSGQTLARLVNSDEYWVEISVPVHELQWLQIPGSKARVILDGGRGERNGEVIRLTGELDAGSRMATLLVSVPEPLSHEPRLILGDYAKVVLAGKEIENARRIPLTWVQDGDTVWLKENGKLAFQPVEIIYRDRDYAYIGKGLLAGDEIVSSDISVPVKGMKVRTREDQIPSSSAKAEDPL